MKRFVLGRLPITRRLISQKGAVGRGNENWNDVDFALVEVTWSRRTHVFPMLEWLSEFAVTTVIAQGAFDRSHSIAYVGDKVRTGTVVC